MAGADTGTKTGHNETVRESHKQGDAADIDTGTGWI